LPMPGILPTSITAAVVLTSCSVARDPSCQRPKPLAYDEPTLKEI